MSTAGADQMAELAAWAQELTGEPIQGIERRPGGGRHEAWAVKGQNGGLWFLRADSAQPSNNEHYTLRRESEIYAAVASVGLPVPKIIGVHPVYEAVLMEFVPGEARFAPLDPQAQAAVVADFAPLLARLHTADPAQLDLPSLAPVMSITDHVEQELDVWESRLQAVPAPHPFPRACFAWLRQNLPAVDGSPSLVQGDTGPGNFLHDGRRVTALLDFELAHLGDPMEDLAWVGTRNAQDPVPDFDAFLAQYAEAGGVAFDGDRFRYHSLFAELRIVVLGAERDAAGGPAPMGDLGSGLIFGTLHQRLTLEALCAAVGEPLPVLADLPAADTEQTPYFDGVLQQMKDLIGPAIADPFATQRLKSLARVVKHLREADRIGSEALIEAELDDLEAVLGHRPPSSVEGRSELDRRVRAGEMNAKDLIPLAAADVSRAHQLAAAAMGSLATRHLPYAGERG